MQNLTPMMKQYLSIKENYKDCILFFRLGDFYEMFFDDAKEASEILDITLTGKACGNNNKAPMCGIPYHSCKSYIQKLLNSGKKIAICEQVEDPKEAKGIVKRDIVKIITPGTVLDDEMIENSSNNYIMSVVNATKDKLFVSYVDVTTGEVNNTVSSYSEISNLIFATSPSELIIDELFEKKLKQNDFKNSQIINSLIEVNKAVVNIVKYEELSEFLDKFEIPKDTQVSLVYIYKYVYETQKFFDINFFYEKESSSHMYLDYYTLKNLEITESIRKNNAYTLFWVLNKTNTSMGARLLKQYLIKPLNDINQIKKRLDYVSAFADDYSTSTSVSKLLKQIYDLERIANRIAYDTVSHKDLLNLKDSIEAMENIKYLLQNQENRDLLNLCNTIKLESLKEVYKIIDQSIQPLEDDYSREHIIKSSFNRELEHYRDLVENTSNVLLKMEENEREKTGIKSLKISFNKIHGYYIEISKAQLQNVTLPKDYERRQTLVASERFINDELKNIEQEILNAKHNESILENRLFREIKSELRNYIKNIVTASQTVARIDVYLAFAKIAVQNDYVKPIITQNKDIVIKNARHPVIEKLLADNAYVPNDTELKDGFTHIITGPNMAGKSTYMRQVAIITLMAHIGSFVPASFAQIPIVDAIFTRIGANDDITVGQSTFMVEMMEVSNILKNAGKDSLVILDEIGRGTSTYDGMSLAFSIVEYICKNIKSKTLISTHYHELTDLEKKYKNIQNYCMLVDETDEIKFLRKVVKGRANKSYGIHVAKLADIPYEVLQRASVILDKLESSDSNRQNLKKEDKNEDQVSIMDFKNNYNLDIIQDIKKIDINNFTPMQALEYLNDLKNRIR